MLTPVFTKQFKKDFKKAERDQTRKISDAEIVFGLLLSQKTLPTKYKDHSLKGRYKDRRECHIYPDWLLIYKPEPENQRIIFERMGSHSELFKL